MVMTDVAPPLDLLLEEHRSELTGYCYRMLGSSFDAQDAVQETMIRAWKAYDRFEGRSSLRSWLYRIATNVCLDMLKGSKRRARPSDMAPAGDPDHFDMTTLSEAHWIEPMPDPAEAVVDHETVQLAFLSTIQHLPPRQRAVLLLREVLRWKAEEVAELLETSVPSVNSALQRARATMSTVEVGHGTGGGEDDQALLARYVEVFERYDVDAFVQLLHDDAAMTMPPFPFWIQGPAQLGSFWTGPGAACEGSKVLPAGYANGLPAIATYKPSGPNGEHEPWSIQLLEMRDGKIAHIHTFLDTKLFELFGLPAAP